MILFENYFKISDSHRPMTFSTGINVFTTYFPQHVFKKLEGLCYFMYLCNESVNVYKYGQYGFRFEKNKTSQLNF